MENLKLSILHVSHLSNEDAASLFGLSCEIAEPVQSEMGELLLAAFAKLKANNKPFMQQINKLHKSALTDDVLAAHKVCDNVFAEIKRTVVYESKSRDVNKKDAALALDFFLKPYRDVTKSPLVTQIELSAECCAKYNADAAIKSAATKIGVDTLFAEFETDNHKLSSIYKTRNEEVSQRSTSGTDLRPAASESYQQFCTVLEQAVNLTPKPALIKLFNSIDELRKKHHALLPNAKAKKGEEE
ncbi:MAG: hypothetical protein HXX18_08820 [Bacteroidetes bacterium]|nr:hypothetical protein [Bacteroidota bacterium]